MFGCILCLLVICGGWNGLLKPEIDPAYLWFQRSGSIVVFLSLYLDFNISKEKTRMNNQFPNSHEGDFVENFEKHLPVFIILHIACLTTAVIGTVIWGYGDLLFKYFT